jgi:hypothetical protein
MPDICGFLENPTLPSGRRYCEWYRTYLGPKYCPDRSSEFLGLPAATLAWLTPQDCYALRCSMLHQGYDDLTGQRCRDVLNEVIFISPGSNYKGMYAHCIRLSNVTINGRHFDDAVVLKVENFCEDMCEAVANWHSTVTENLPVIERMNELLRVY